MSARRLREWPRLVAGAVVLAAVLVGIGLLVGAEALGSHTTTTTTTTTTVQRAAAATTTTVASRADEREIRALRHELARARARRRAATASHPTHPHPTTHHRR